MMSGLAGLQVGNSKVKRFEKALEQGELLIMVDVVKEQIDEISQVILEHHPSAEFEGLESILPPSY